GVVLGIEIDRGLHRERELIMSLAPLEAGKQSRGKRDDDRCNGDDGLPAAHGLSRSIVSGLMHRCKERSMSPSAEHAWYQKKKGRAGSRGLEFQGGKARRTYGTKRRRGCRACPALPFYRQEVKDSLTCK